LKVGTNQTLPILRQMLQSADGGKEKIATECLWNLDRAAEPAWPELLALIKNDNSDLAAVSYACRILWQFDRTDLSAVPALRARLARMGETTAGLETAVLLVRFDASQTEALDLLLKVSADRNSGSREMAINCLGAVGKNARRAGQLLYDIATTDAPHLWSSAAYAMLKIGETNLAMEAAYHHLTWRNQELTATYFLTRCDPTNAVAVTRLRELAWQRPYCETAISQLGQLRPMPAAALQTLWEVSTNETHFARADATKALKILKAEQTQSLSDGR